jgi:hypothetical protein
MKKILLFVGALGFSLYANELQSSGEVYVNDKLATPNTVVKVGDFIKTGQKSKVKFNIGNDAFMAKENTKFTVTQKEGLKTLNVVSGGVLAVFGEGGNHEVKTENMTAGIRGTGVYLEQLEGKSYFCTCYGETALESHTSHQNLLATHHNMVWVKEDGTIKPEGKMLGHTDDELRELEAMVGRIPPFDKK